MRQPTCSNRYTYLLAARLYILFLALSLSLAHVSKANDIRFNRTRNTICARDPQHTMHGLRQPTDRPATTTTASPCHPTRRRHFIVNHTAAAVVHQSRHNVTALSVAIAQRVVVVVVVADECQCQGHQNTSQQDIRSFPKTNHLSIHPSSLYPFIITVIRGHIHISRTKTHRMYEEYLKVLRLDAHISTPRYFALLHHMHRIDVNQSRPGRQQKHALASKQTLALVDEALLQNHFVVDKPMPLVVQPLCVDALPPFQRRYVEDVCVVKENREKRELVKLRSILWIIY